MCNRGGAVHPGGGHPQVGHDTEADGQDGHLSLDVARAGQQSPKAAVGDPEVLDTAGEAEGQVRAGAALEGE